MVARNEVYLNMTAQTERRMTKGEHDDLCRLVKQREKVAKTAAEQRSAAMLAEFEQQISALHTFNNNDVWKAAVEAANEAARAANQSIVREADKLGIPKEFQPKLMFSWERRGENEYQVRRNELRKLETHPHATTAEALADPTGEEAARPRLAILQTPVSGALL